MGAGYSTDPGETTDRCKSRQIARTGFRGARRSGPVLFVDVFPTHPEFEMSTLSQVDRRLTVLALCVALTGCASVTPIPYAEVASSSYLAPNPSDASGHMPYRYSTAIDWRFYNKVVLEPVVICRGSDQQFGDMSEDD